MSNEELGINSSFFTPHSSFICTSDLNDGGSSNALPHAYVHDGAHVRGNSVLPRVCGRCAVLGH